MTTLTGPDQIPFHGRVIDSVMLYGFKSCGYKDVALRPFYYFIKQIYNLSLGDHTTQHPSTRGGYVPKITIDHPDFDRKCKAALVNLVLDNLLKSRGDLSKTPITPCLFCIDSDEFSLNWQLLIAEKSRELPRSTTRREIDRAYKLCYDPSLPEEIRQVAQNTFMFVRVKLKEIQERTNTTAEECFEVIPAPWDAFPNPQRIAELEKKHKLRSDHLEAPRERKFIEGSYWRDQVTQFYFSLDQKEDLPVQKKALPAFLCNESEK